MKFPGSNLSKFENDALGIALSASERAGLRVTHLVFANQPYPLPLLARLHWMREH